MKMFSILTVGHNRIEVVQYPDIGAAETEFNRIQKEETVAVFLFSPDGLLSSFDVAERLRVWIWEQRDKHGDALEALGPAFDLILNKIDEFRDEKGSGSA